MKVENKYTAQEYYDKLIKAVKEQQKKDRNWNYMVYKGFLDSINEVFEAEEECKPISDRELHIHISQSTMEDRILATYNATDYEAKTSQNIVHTTQLACCSFKYDRRIFIHYGAEVHEITLGDCVGTKKKIDRSTDILDMLLSGEFDWFPAKED